MMLDLWRFVMGGFWNQILEIKKMILEPLCFGTFLLPKIGTKNGIHGKPPISRLNCPPVSFAPMQIFSSYFQLPQLLCSGNFRWVNFRFNSFFRKQFKIQDPIWGVHLSTKTWFLVLFLIRVPDDDFIVWLVPKVLMWVSGESVVSQILKNMFFLKMVLCFSMFW